MQLRPALPLSLVSAFPVLSIVCAMAVPPRCWAWIGMWW